jgi:hypothetical protein
MMASLPILARINHSSRTARAIPPIGLARDSFRRPGFVWSLPNLTARRLSFLKLYTRSEVRYLLEEAFDVGSAWATNAADGWALRR